MSRRAARKMPKPSAIPHRLDTSFLRARPWIARQVGKAPGLALFWKAGPADSRLGMLWILTVCSDPLCPCRDVKVEARSVPDSLAYVKVIGDHTELASIPDPGAHEAPAARSEALAFLNIDIDTGAISPADQRTPDAELLAWARAEIDAELLAHLRAAWRAAKGMEPVEAKSPIFI